jgi:hypothetical protein
MKTYVAISVLILLFTQSVYAQNNPDKLVRTFKNSIHLSSGYYLNASLEYDRALFAGAEGLVSVYAALTGGYRQFESGAGPFSELKGIVLMGRKSHHVEFTAGGMLFFDRYDYYYEREYGWNTSAVEKSDFLYLVPSFTLGYRYQKPGGRLVFKLGTGRPVNKFYVGLGFAF